MTPEAKMVLEGLEYVHKQSMSQNLCYQLLPPPPPRFPPSSPHLPLANMPDTLPRFLP